MNFLSLLKQILKEEENVIDSTSDMEQILSRSPKVTAVLIKLLTDQKSNSDKATKQLRQIITDIKAISLKPTTFRIVLKNGNYFTLKYTPSPLQLKYPDKFDESDSFTVVVSGKRFNIENRAEFEQALDYLAKIMSTQPVSQGKQGEDQTPPTDDKNTEDQPGEDDTEEPAED